MTFRVGQMVAAVKTHYHGGTDATIIKGNIYTVRGLTQCEITHRWGVFLEEMVLPMHDFFGEEYGWLAEHFKPVVTPSIEVFQVMPVPADKRSRQDA
jgi:hypothetical protein